jgi:hypothetical protein
MRSHFEAMCRAAPNPAFRTDGFEYSLDFPRSAASIGNASDSDSFCRSVIVQNGN